MTATHRFGPFELDVANAELRRNGAPVRISPQPFAALVLLVERAGTLVTRDEMRVALWGDDHHVDYNAGLNFCMAQLRSALGEEAKGLIQTVPRRGYRFVGAFETPDRVPAKPRRAFDRRWVAAAALLLVGLTATAVRFSAAPHPPAGSSSIEALALREHAALGLADTGPGGLADRIGELQRALQADPQYALAYADLAEAHLMEAQYRVGAPQLAYALAKAAATRALQLDPSLGDAHVAYAAAVLHLEWNWADARTHFNKAVRLAPDSPRVLYWHSRYLAAAGQFDDAVRTAAHATEVEPQGIRTRANLGFVSLYARRYGEALASCEQALAMLPKFTPARFCAADAAVGAGALERAVLHTSAVTESEDDVHWLRKATTEDGVAGYWRAEYRQVEMQGCDRNAFWAATVLARLGENDRALGWLERAVELHADSVVYAGMHPAFDRLRDHPRFQQVLQRIGRQ